MSARSPRKVRRLCPWIRGDASQARLKWTIDQPRGPLRRPQVGPWRLDSGQQPCHSNSVATLALMGRLSASADRRTADRLAVTSLNGRGDTDALSRKCGLERRRLPRRRERRMRRSFPRYPRRRAFRVCRRSRLASLRPRGGVRRNPGRNRVRRSRRVDGAVRFVRRGASGRPHGDAAGER